MPPFFPQICEMSLAYFFKILPGDFTHLHQTLHTSSVYSSVEILDIPNYSTISNAKVVLAHKSHTTCRTFVNLISMWSLNSAELHFHGNFLFTKSQTMKNLLFRTPPRRFDRFAPNFACSMCGPSWQK